MYSQSMKPKVVVLICLLTIIAASFYTLILSIKPVSMISKGVLKEQQHQIQQQGNNNNEKEDNQVGLPQSRQGVDACLLPISSNFSDIRIPLVRHEKRSYLIPNPKEDRATNALSETQLERDAIFVFIHINKAGGTLIKEEVFKPVAVDRNWDGAGFGSTVGWRQLLKLCTSKSGNDVTPDEAMACGKSVPLSSCGPVSGGKCPLRLLWGTHAMGICQLHPNQPCVMTVILRHPIQRAISQYNYVCVEGKEGQKKWAESWKLAGRCPLTLLQFLETDLTSKTFLIDHLARTVDPNCGFAIALENLSHPCVRFLLLDQLSDGLKRLATAWGPAMRPHLTRIAELSSVEKKNHAPYQARIMSQINDAEILAKVQTMLRLDIEF